MKNILKKFSNLLSSKRFFWIIVGFFIFESVWIAVSAVYPQAFDEDFHFGLIKVYSHYWLPFLTHQPSNANAYGAVAVDPSYLYHYLMSFPFRFIELFTHSQTIQVILIRLIDIAFFSAGLVLFRIILLRAHLSKALSNVCLAVFVLIPVVPQLAAQVNYDTLLFPLTALVILLTFKVIDEINKKQPDIGSLLILFSVCIFTSLVKDAFFPIFLAVILFLIVFVFRKFRGQLKKFFYLLIYSWKRLTWQRQLLLVVVTVLALGMFGQRDIANIIKYHTLEPNCSAVLSVNQCNAYSAWQYSYNSHQYVLSNKGSITYLNPLYYLGSWLYWMWYRLFFAVNGPASQFTNYPPLPLASATAAILGIAGVFFVIKYRRQIFKNNPYFSLLFVVCGLYILALLLDGYAQYHYTNELVTMNGRYLLPILLLVAAIFGSAYSHALHKMELRKTLITALILLFLMQGGGFLTFVTRSDSSWDWPNPLVIKTNNAVRKITKPIIVKGSKTYTTKYWVLN